MHIHTLLCFGAAPGAGNPALVVEHDRQDGAGRQAFARARGTTCVFLDTVADGARQVDFYYPHMRSPLCLHATLAVAAVLFARRADADTDADADAGAGADTIAVRTAVTGQMLELVRGDDTHGDGVYFVRLRRQPVPSPGVDAATVAALLNLPATALPGAPAVASVGSPKLLVEVADARTLHALAPDLAGIAAWGRAHGVNGIYAYCRQGDSLVEGRNFNHLDPRLEDSATGVAAGALTLLLGRALTLRQGRATGRDCLISTRIEEETILVGGAAQPA